MKHSGQSPGYLATLLRFDDAVGWLPMRLSAEVGGHCCRLPVNRISVYSAAGGRLGAGKEAASSGVAPEDAGSRPPGILYTQ